MDDIVLVFDDLDKYFEESPYFIAIIGRLGTGLPMARLIWMVKNIHLSLIIWVTTYMAVLRALIRYFGIKEFDVILNDSLILTEEDLMPKTNK